ncbi:hypothetical protein Csa_022676 [Cucumis sativus]|nr:hypothetical protein Csa_022676 [Cucumis sativus]
MVKLLITAVSYIGDDIASDIDGVEEGNAKLYRRKVVENPALLDVIDYLTEKDKDDSKDDHDNDEPRRHQNDDFDEHEPDETDEHDDYEENFVPHTDNRRSLGVLGGSVKRLKRGQDHDDAHACGNSLSPLDCNKSSHPHSQAQFTQADTAHLETESMKASTSQKQWMELRLLQLEDQKLQIQVEMLELEKQKFKWERFNKKKDRELEKMRMVNERMKLENERLALDLKQKQIGSGFH